MIATAQLESTVSTVDALADVTDSPKRSDVLLGHDATRERELDLMAANIESAAEGVGIFLLLALFSTAFVIATLTGVFA